MRDPHERKILEGLEGPLDPQLFEECAVDLLRGVYSGLVPIHGGGDFGMDGAIADGEGAPFPLIVTTAEDVIGNLTKNLDSYLAGGGLRRRAVVATSTTLTPARRRNLEQRAREKGFTLLQVHERRDFADRLYRNSRWTLDLLGITGAPPALSSIPSTRRPLRDDLELVGRGADLEWLRTTDGDRLIVGQPGSGKTYLALQLVRDGEALFLASEDQRRIVEALRDLQPTAVIVDDAHFEPGTLDRLRHIREEIGTSFDIVATAWPGFDHDLRDALGGIPSGQTRHLEPLTRAQILAVLRGVGVQEADGHPVLRHLVDQVSNKPGLAVTLGSLWVLGEWLEVLTGDALRGTLIPSLKRVLEYDPTELLACIAMGGNRGMSMDTVANFLGMGRGELHQRANMASQGGVLKVVEDDSLAVEPSLLRPALVREIFFPRPTQPALSYRALFNALERVEDRRAFTEALTSAARVGVDVPYEYLQDLVTEYGTPRAWAEFAILGEEQSRWVLNHYPNDCLDIIEPALQRVPHLAVQRILQLPAEAHSTKLTSAQAFKVLEQWLEDSGDPSWSGLPTPVRRREIVIEVAEQILDGGGSKDVALLAALTALIPRLEASSITATGDAIVWRSDFLSPSTIPRMRELWSRVLPRIETWTAELWSRMGTVIRYWALPEFLGQELDDEPYRDVARRIVEDLGQRFPRRSGLQNALAPWRVRLDMELAAPIDEEFRILFPLQEHLTAENWVEEHERQNREAAALASLWAERPAVEIAGKLSDYEQEASVFGHESWATSGSVYDTLAREVDDPHEWFAELAATELNPRYAPYLLKRIIVSKRKGWRQLVQKSLEDEQFSSLTSLLILKAENVPGPLLEKALVSSALEPFDVGGACLRRELPPANVRRLLRHPREEISSAAAIHEWLADPKGRIQEALDNDWKDAIRRSATLRGRPIQSTDHWLAEILAGSPDLAFEWVTTYLESVSPPNAWMPEKVLRSAARAMTIEQRIQLLRELKPRPAYALGWALGLVVDSSAEVYRALLAIEPLRFHHLASLRGRPPDATWMELALLALGAGHTAGEIAAQAFSSTGAHSGFGESHWTKWQEGFSRLVQSEEPGLRAIAEHGLQIAGNFLNRSRAMKRQFELTGSF